MNIDAALLRTEVLDACKRLGVTVQELPEWPTYGDVITSDDGKTVQLNQWFYTSFKVLDKELDGCYDLNQVYTIPGVQSVVRGLERSVCGLVASRLAPAAAFKAAGRVIDTHIAGYALFIQINETPRTSQSQLEIGATIEIAGARYTIIERNENGNEDDSVLLDRPLDKAIEEGSVILAGPVFDLQVDCAGVTVVFAVRPPQQQYQGPNNGDNGGTIVSLDLLAGFAADFNKCCIREPVSV